jgi:hypothetical protein
MVVVEVFYIGFILDRFIILYNHYHIDYHYLYYHYHYYYFILPLLLLLIDDVLPLIDDIDDVLLLKNFLIFI